jgi:hypothetical protein
VFAAVCCEMKSERAEEELCISKNSTGINIYVYEIGWMVRRLGQVPEASVKGELQ